MAHRAFRGRGISQSQRRKKTWVQLTNLVSAGVTPGFVTSFGLGVTPSATFGVGVRDGFIGITGDGTGDNPFLSSLPAESTILRVRGSMSFPKYFQSDVSSSLNNDTGFGFGVTGITNLLSSSYPSPISDASWDGWMFKRTSSVGPVDSIGTVIDVKAMRKIQTGDAFFVMAEHVQGQGGTNVVGVNWQFDLRLLILLP